MLMRQSESTMKNLDGAAKITHLDDGGIVFSLQKPEGIISMTRYSVFPGITLIYNDIHVSQFRSDLTKSDRNLFEIDHCRDGRMEFYIEEEKCSLAPGDIVLHRLGDSLREEVFPTGHFHGITIQIDLNNSPKCLSAFLQDVNIEPSAICNKFLPDERLYYALRQIPSVEHIFSELYDLPESVKQGYFKVKILELFLFLSGLEKNTGIAEHRGISEHQAALAKNICSYLTEHIEQRITIAELAELFDVSAARIRSSFSGVYGMSIHSYMRAQRMRAAAKLLQSTDRTVLDIAGQFGYDNGSKFASAFRAVMGVTPAQYRNSQYRKK